VIEMSPDHDFGNLTLLDPREVRLRRDERHRIVLELGEGRRHEHVMVTHTFPVSRPGKFVLLRDAHGGEIGLIPDADALDRESREVLAEELDRAYFMPRILSVTDIEDQFGIATWQVITDRGPTRFQVRARTESVWSFGGGRYLIKDVEGNRFDIPSLADLDDRSRMLVEMQI
jgi:hypothetical protein